MTWSRQTPHLARCWQVLMPSFVACTTWLCGRSCSCSSRSSSDSQITSRSTFSQPQRCWYCHSLPRCTVQLQADEDLVCYGKILGDLSSRIMTTFNKEFKCILLDQQGIQLLTVWITVGLSEFSVNIWQLKCSLVFKIIMSSQSSHHDHFSICFSPRILCIFPSLLHIPHVICLALPPSLSTSFCVFLSWYCLLLSVMSLHPVNRES